MNRVKTCAIGALVLFLSQGVFASLMIVGKNDANNWAELTYEGNTIKLANHSTGVITGFGFYAETDDLKLIDVEYTGDDGGWGLLTGKNAKGSEYAVGTGKNVFGGKVSKGIDKGGMGVFKFDLEDSVAFSNIHKVFVRFQETTNADGGTSDKGYQCLRSDQCKPITVPEPGTVALLVAGLLGLVASRRKT